MITIEDIVNYALNNNILFECYSECFHKDNFGDIYYMLGSTHVGLELKKNVWYWWETSNSKNHECYLTFRQRYNRNNGAVQKTFKKGFEAMVIIKDLKF